MSSEKRDPPSDAHRLKKTHINFARSPTRAERDIKYPFEDTNDRRWLWKVATLNKNKRVVRVSWRIRDDERSPLLSSWNVLSTIVPDRRWLMELGGKLAAWPTQLAGERRAPPVLCHARTERQLSGLRLTGNRLLCEFYGNVRRYEGRKLLVRIFDGFGVLGVLRQRA